MTLTEFLLARIAEDEATGNAADPWRDDAPSMWPLMSAVDTMLAAQSPARVLAECEAKRRIMRRHTLKNGPEDWMDQEWRDDCRPVCGWCTYDNRAVGYPCPDLRDLALPYADHQDYRAEWKP